MSTHRLILGFAVCSMFGNTGHAQTPPVPPTHTTPVQTAPDAATEALINQLPRVSEMGIGFNTQFSGSQFLPNRKSTQASMLVLGAAMTDSPILEKIVKRGVRAVPSLLKHLDDRRTTKIPKLSGMMWTAFPDEYDYNHRVRDIRPKGVNRDSAPPWRENDPKSHIVTVGDLCFVALGQIVNRNFSAIRYQPTGGLIVNSPTYSKALCAAARADFQGLDEAGHRQLLIQDFTTPDHENRLISAYQRLSFYYPSATEPLVLKQLAVPTYNILVVEDFVQQKLYKEKSPKVRQKLFDEFVASHGKAYADGIQVYLFQRFGLHQEAKGLLIQLYGFKEDVKIYNRPYMTTWESARLARFIESLLPDKNHKIDAAVYVILSKIKDEDYLALACMKKLMGRGYNQAIRRYCERRIPKSQHFAEELRAVLKQLNAQNRQKLNKQP